jgi:hypothetical protein
MATPDSRKRAHRPGIRMRPSTAIVLLLVLMSGCLARRQVVFQEMDALHDEAAPRTIAILPFVDQTGTPALGHMVRESLYGHLSYRPFEDVELARVDHVLQDAKDIAVAQLSPQALRQLGARLGCDAVVTGTVTEFERLYMGIYSQLSVGAEIVIYDTHDGRRLWSDRYVARLQDGSVPLTPLGIPLSGARSGWNLRDSQIVRAVDELARYLADRIPGPDAPEVVAAAWRFELQTGAYLDHQAALDQRDALNSLGFPAAVHTEEQGQTVWHRVMVGPYADESEALRVRSQLENALGLRPLIRRRPL